MSAFVTLEELLSDPEPLDLVVRARDKKTKKAIDSVLRVYPRRPNDREKEMITSSANAARRALRKRLTDESTDEYRYMLQEPLEDTDEAGLRMLWINGNLMQRAAEMQLQSLEEREVVPEPEGDIVPADVQDAYVEAVESSEKDRVAQLVKAIESARRELSGEAEAIPVDALREAAKPAHIENLVGQEWNSVYTANLLARCTFNDAKHLKPTFKTVKDVEEFRSRQPKAFEALADTHRGLLLELEPALGN